MSPSTNQRPHRKLLSNEHVFVKDRIYHKLLPITTHLTLLLISGSDHSWLEWWVLRRWLKRSWGGQSQGGPGGGQQQLCVCGRGDQDREVHHQIQTEQEEGRYPTHSLGNKGKFNHCNACEAVRRAKYHHISQFFLSTNCYLTSSYPLRMMEYEIHSNVCMILSLFHEFDFKMVNFMRCITGLLEHWHWVTKHQMHWPQPIDTR